MFSVDRKKIFCLAAGALLSTSALATEVGPYFGLQFGSTTGGTVQGYGQGLSLGYQANSVLAFEGTFLTAVSSPTFQAYSLLGKATWMFDNNFGFFGKLGVAYYFPNSAASSNIAPTAALGFSYDFTPRFVGSILWTGIQQTNPMPDSVNYYALDLTYRF